MDGSAYLGNNCFLTFGNIRCTANNLKSCCIADIHLSYLQPVCIGMRSHRYHLPANQTFQIAFYRTVRVNALYLQTDIGEDCCSMVKIIRLG